MAGPSKKSRKELNCSSDHESSSNESECETSESYDGQEEIEATFEGRNPEPQDFHGIKRLLHQLFLKAHVDLTQLSDLLIDQHGIGSVLKQAVDSDDSDDPDEQEHVFGITSVVNLGAQKGSPCIQQFFELLNDLIGKHATDEVSNTVRDIFNSNSRIGFIVNERFVNVPAKLASVMLDSLYREIERRKVKDKTYDFQYYVMMCKTCKQKGTEDSEFFVNDEEQVFAEAADVNLEYSVEKDADTGLSGKWKSEDKQLVPYRRILLIKGEKFKEIIEKIGELSK